MGWNVLPTELLENIGCLLELHDLIWLTCVCQSWYTSMSPRYNNQTISQYKTCITSQNCLLKATELYLKLIPRNPDVRALKPLNKSCGLSRQNHTENPHQNHPYSRQNTDKNIPKSFLQDSMSLSLSLSLTLSGCTVMHVFYISLYVYILSI